MSILCQLFLICIMKFTENFNLKDYNTFRISSIAKHFVEINSKADLKLLIKDNHFLNEKKLVLSGGSNLLLPDFYDGLVIYLNTNGLEKEDFEDYSILKVQAGENWHNFIKYTIDNELYGLENLALIPGNIGTAPVQNIGAYGVEQDDCFIKCEVFDFKSGEFYLLNKEECQFAYRDSIFKNELLGKVIITEVWYKLSKTPNYNLSYMELKEHFVKNEVSLKAVFDFVVETRKSKLDDPKEIGNCGSFFKNPIISTTQLNELKVRFPEIKYYSYDEENVKISAAYLIENVGFKGYRVGDAGVSPKHSLVLINYGEATSKDIFALSQEIINKIKLCFNIELEREVNII